MYNQRSYTVLKVLHVSKFYTPFCGGLERVVEQLSEGAINKGHQVRVLCSTHNNELSHFDVLGGVHVYRFKTLLNFLGQPLSFSFFLKIKNHLRWADVIYVHTPNPLVEFALLLFAPRKSKIVILHHSDIVRQKLINRVISPIQKLFYQRANKIVVATLNHVRYSNICSYFEDKVSIIPFGIPARNVFYSEAIMKSNYGLFVGRLVNYKGLHYLVEAMSSVDGELKIVGDGPLRQSLQKMINDMGLKHKITLLGTVAEEELSQLYQNCQFLVLPSVTKAENFGLVQIEAMSYGRPVIATRIKSGASCIVEDKKSGFLVEPCNVEQLAARMNQLFLNPYLADEMGKEALKQFNHVYSLDRMMRAHENLIYSLSDDHVSEVKRLAA